MNHDNHAGFNNPARGRRDRGRRRRHWQGRDTAVTMITVLRQFGRGRAGRHGGGCDRSSRPLPLAGAALGLDSVESDS
jgi:hypothetical protein